jgi:predicted nuclease with TOPRIM domain
MEEKAKITFRFLQAKLSEYEELKTEIEEIRKEASQLSDKTSV